MIKHRAFLHRAITLNAGAGTVCPEAGKLVASLHTAGYRPRTSRMFSLRMFTATTRPDSPSRGQRSFPTQPCMCNGRCRFLACPSQCRTSSAPRSRLCASPARPGAMPDIGQAASRCRGRRDRPGHPYTACRRAYSGKFVLLGRERRTEAGAIGRPHPRQGCALPQAGHRDQLRCGRCGRSQATHGCYGGHCIEGIYGGSRAYQFSRYRQDHGAAWIVLLAVGELQRSSTAQERRGTLTVACRPFGRQGGCELADQPNSLLAVRATSSPW